MVALLPADELGQIFLSLPVSFCLLDREARYIAANHRYAALCGATIDDLIGKPMAEFCARDLVKNALRDFSVFDAGGCVPDHEIIYRDNAFLVAVSPLYRGSDETAFAIAVALTDITKLKKLESGLSVANSNLLAAYKETKIIAETDALTGLGNRHGLGNFFEREIRRCRRDRNPVWVAIVDVDGFKSYNDRCGHLVGDESLKSIAAAIDSSVRRPGDCAARYGGDEFVVVLPNIDLAGAEHVGRAIQKAVDDLAIRHDHSPFGHLTVSIGISGLIAIPYNVSSASIRDSLLRSADKALYEVKRLGRNGIMVWNENSEASVRKPEKGEA
jgi:diguanylate cyclase (GGDEF)-like protein/PAS domain S-box-containing protein